MDEQKRPDQCVIGQCGNSNSNPASLEAQEWLREQGIREGHPLLKACRTHIESELRWLINEERTGLDASTHLRDVGTRKVEKEGSPSLPTSKERKKPRKRASTPSIPIPEEPKPKPPETIGLHLLAIQLGVTEKEAEALTGFGYLTVASISETGVTFVTKESARALVGSVLALGERYQALPEGIREKMERHRLKYLDLIGPGGVLDR